MAETVLTFALFQDYIIEKVKKIGGFTTFNNFIMKELEIMYRLLNEIKTTLTVSVQASFLCILCACGCLTMSPVAPCRGVRGQPQDLKHEIV